MAGAFFYTVANAYAHEDSPVESGLDLSPVGKVLGLLLFGFVVMRLARRRAREEHEDADSSNRSVKPVYVWLVVLGGLALLYWKMG